jgi:hypothetical protein
MAVKDKSKKKFQTLSYDYAEPQSYLTHRKTEKLTQKGKITLNSRQQEVLQWPL